MDPILERPDNWVTGVYEWGDHILYSVADSLGISYYDLCTYIFVYLYAFIVVALLVIIVIQMILIRKRGENAKMNNSTEQPA